MQNTIGQQQHSTYKTKSIKGRLNHCVQKYFEQKAIEQAAGIGLCGEAACENYLWHDEIKTEYRSFGKANQTNF